MSNNPTMKPGLARPSLDNRVVLFVPAGETGLAVRQRRRSDNLFARLRSRKLDAQLAAGTPPERGRQLAVRAAMLTSPDSRELLALCWEDLVLSAHRPRRPYDPHVPVAAAQIKAAEDDISRLVLALRAPQPVAARGMAVATDLLQDGRGPVYNSSSHRSLTGAVRDAERHLGAAMSLVVG
jgi:hypothetical protein